MTALERGAVVEHPPVFDFDDYPRPYLIVSGDDHPFFGEEYVAMAITTTALEAAIPIDDADWELGELPRQSYIKPWQPILLKHADVEDAYGLLRSAAVDRAALVLAEITGGWPADYE